MEKSAIREIEQQIMLSLTERELLLIKWSLELMAADCQKGGIMRYDVDSVRDKLAMIAYPHIEQN